MFQRYARQIYGAPLPPLKREVAKIPRIFAGGILLQCKLIPCSESTRPQAAAAVVQPIPQTHRILKYACASPLCKGAMAQRRMNCERLI